MLILKTVVLARI